MQHCWASTFNARVLYYRLSRGMPAEMPVGVVVQRMVPSQKSGVIFTLARVSKLPANPGQLAVGLGQVGEFGFVLATVAVTRGVLPPAVYAALLAAVAISIAVSSISVRYVRRASPVVASADA